MMQNLRPRSWAVAVGVLLVLTLLLSLSGSEILTGIGFLLVLGVIAYFRRMESVSEKAVSKRIKADYPPETQLEVFEIYEHLKRKEMEGLFLKILEEASGDLSKVKSLTSLAESVGWKAFLENHW